MNNHRIPPLAFILALALCMPLLILPGHERRKPIAGVLVHLDKTARANWSRWREKNEGYIELVSINQR